MGLSMIGVANRTRNVGEGNLLPFHFLFKKKKKKKNTCVVSTCVWEGYRRYTLLLTAVVLYTQRDNS